MTASKPAILGGKPIGPVPADPHPAFTKRAVARAVRLLEKGMTVGLGKHHPVIAEGEEAVARWQQVEHAMVLSSGHASLQMALHGLEVGPAAEELLWDVHVERIYLERRRVLNFLESIDDAARRATRIVADMLSFSRRSQRERFSVRMMDMLDTAVRLASTDHDLKKNYHFDRIEIIKDYDAELGEVYCERTGIEQVLLNLLKNAAQAMSEAGTPAPRRIIAR